LFPLQDEICLERGLARSRAFIAPSGFALNRSCNLFVASRKKELHVRRLVYISLVGLFLTGPTAANAAPAMETRPPPPKPPLQLTEAQRQQVLQAVVAKNTDDKLPADFQPANGAQVPSQQKLPLHPLPRPLVYQLPVLKQYYYAKLSSRVLIVDPMTRKIVDVIAR
jgi:Protein of unknown function (DUF1236)